jgi:hypothetical protein
VSECVVEVHTSRVATRVCLFGSVFMMRVVRAGVDICGVRGHSDSAHADDCKGTRQAAGASLPRAPDRYSQHRRRPAQQSPLHTLSL